MVFQIDNRAVLTSFVKVLNVYWPSVVVTLNRVDSNRLVLESVFNHLSGLEIIVRHLNLSISHSIVRGVISCPEN